MQDFNLTKQGNTLTVYISCELDHHKAVGLRDAIDKRLTDGGIKLLVLDFSGVPFMDSSGIGLIMGRADKASETGCRVRVTGLIPTLSRLVRLSGISKLENLEIN